MAPQQLEKIETAPVNGMGSVASTPQHLVHGRATTVRKVESDVTPELLLLEHESELRRRAADSGSFVMRFILVLASGAWGGRLGWEIFRLATR